MIYIASDHGGFALKQKLTEYFLKKKIEFLDLGPSKLNMKDDYPDFAEKLSKKVSEDSEKNIGILLCRSGQGMCIAANKIKGIRAISAWNVQLAKSARNDDFANVLCIAGDFISQNSAIKITETFIKTPFSKIPRYKRRLEKVKKMEAL